MNATVRAGALLAVLAGLASLLPAQPPPLRGPETAEAPKFRLASDNRAAVVLQAIREHLADPDWDRLVPALQAVLDHGDALIERDGVVSTARAAALRLFKEWPEAGQVAYRERYDPVARDLVEQARKQDDPQPLVEVLRRYEATTPAAAALEALGVLYAKQGRAAEAAAVFARLPERMPLKDWSPAAVYHAARVLGRGDTPLARQVLARLGEIAGGDGVVIDGAKVKAADVEAELKAAKAIEAGAPLPVPTWTDRPATLTPELAARLNEAATARHRRGEMVPAVSTPVLTTARVEGKERSVVVARTFDGVVCLDADKGTLLWRVPLRDDLVAWVKDPVRAGLAQLWPTTHGPGSTVLFDNTRTGRFALGAGGVSVVEDVPLLARAGNFPGAPPIVPPRSVQESLRNNTLVGIALDSGKLIWEAGGKSVPELEGWFLGAPLVFADTLVALHEKGQELRLVRLDAKTGKVRDVRVLGALARTLSEGDERRRGVQPVVAGGRLLVPTGSGSLLALELPTLHLAWAYEYGEAAPQPMRPFGPQPPAPTGPGLAYEPLAEGDLVVYSAPDTRRIHALDPATGARRWVVLVSDGDRLVGPLLPAGLLVLGDRSLRLLDRKTGETHWRVAIPRPTGRGYLAGSRYVQPVAGEILLVDLKQGVVASRLRTGNALPDGNLVPGGDRVLSAGPDGLALMPQMEGERQRLEKEADKPDGAAARLRLAELDLQLGKPAAALESIRTAQKGKLDPDAVARSRELLFRTLTELLREDAAAFEKHRAEYLQLADVPVPLDAPAAVQKQLRELGEARKGTALRVVAAGHLRAGRPVAAATVALDLLELPGDDPADATTRTAFAAGVLRDALASKPDEAARALAERVAPLLAAGDKLGPARKLLAAYPLRGPTAAHHLKLAQALAGNDAPAADRLFARLARLDDAAVAVPALQGRVRVATSEGRLGDALALARELGARFPGPGKELLDSLATDRRFQPLLEPAKVPQKWQTTEEAFAGPYPPVRHAVVPARSGAGPVLQFDATRGQIVVPAEGDRAEATIALPAGQQFRATLEAQALGNYLHPLRSHDLGRTLLVPLGEWLVALDPVSRQELWKRDRLQGERNASLQFVWVSQRLGWYQTTHAEGWVQIQGPPPAAVGNVLAVTTRGGVEGLDLDTGRVLWKRGDLTAATALLAVGDKLLAVEYDGTTPVATRWLRLEDGSAATGPDLVGAFAGAVAVDAGRVLALGKKEDAPLLRVLDLATGREAWRKELPAGSVVLDSREPGVFGWVEPDGTARLLDLATRAEVAGGTLDKELRGLGAGTILADGRNFYVATLPKVPRPDAVGPTSLFTPMLPGQVALSSDHLLAFDRAGKKLAWYQATPGLYLLVPEPDVPVLVLGSHRTTVEGGRAVSTSTVRLVDRRNGKLLYDKTFPQGEQLLGLKWTPAPAALEVLGRMIRLKVVASAE